MLADLSLHHIGVATKALSAELPVFKGLGYTACSDFFIDPVQKIRGIFLIAPGQPCLELLENLEATGPLDSWLQKGIKFYHFAYETPDIQAAMDKLARGHKAKVIVPPTDAVYFTKVCFLIFPTMMLVELVQPRNER